MLSRQKRGVKFVQQVWYFVQAEGTEEGVETVVSVNKLKNKFPQAQILNTFMV